jgi:N-acetylglucosamine kinase-like BadF-type ATPase
VGRLISSLAPANPVDVIAVYLAGADLPTEADALRSAVTARG